MSVLLMQTKNMFDMWKDSSAETMQNECITPIQRAYNSYTEEMNTHIQIYMRAQQKVAQALQEMEKL